MTCTKRRKLLWIVAGGLWLAAAAAGSQWLGRYETTPGAAAIAPCDWPAGVALTRSAQRPTLVMLVHPECPCTRASLHELGRLMARCQSPLNVYVLFCQSSGKSLSSVHGDLWNLAAAIPGVTPIVDEAGRNASAFGAYVSGQAILYSPAGQLLFKGGVTASRGHLGDNAGSDAIVEIVQGHAPATTAAPVFGCNLLSASTASDAKEAQ